jgi:beta-glucosidase
MKKRETGRSKSFHFLRFSMRSNYLLLIAAIAISVAGILPLHAAPPDNAAAHPWMNRALTPEQRADLLLHAMKLEDKIAMLHGIDPMPIQGYVGYILPDPKLQIPALRMADGRAGVGNGATDVTVLPAPIAVAASWDTVLVHTYGQVLGNEQWGKGTNVSLAPSIDVVRVPEWGRTFESYGEDPYFNGQMAVAEIEGIQSQGPIANANMYLTMNQENNRFNESSVVDARTLHEIYLPPFEAAVQQGHVGTVMCAYVKTNGVYSCESQYLLNDFLKKRLGFGGWVMSDWGATHSTIASLNGGLEQEMPGEYFYNPFSIRTAIKDGQVTTATLDEHVRRILVTMFRFGLFDKQQTGTWATDVRSAEHTVFSRDAAEQGSVLLKNEGNVLPLFDTSSIAVFGDAGSAKPKIAGGGSSGMLASYVVSPLDGIRKRIAGGAKVSYAAGNDLAQAAQVARAAQVAIVFVNTDETEGKDRPNLELPNHQDELISTVATANPNTIVVLDTGGPVLMPWIGKIRGLVEAWYPGQEDGNAIAAILFGDVNPSAKLPLTFPRTATEIPTATPEQWPGTNGNSVYSEKLDVGYRWYDAKNVEPLFPFGYGLSYTTFKLSHFSVSPENLAWSTGAVDKNVRAELDVANTGKRAGAEVVQVYVEQPKVNGEPPRQLRAFTKVALKPGETRHVALTLNQRSFAVYDPTAHAWKFPAGTYRVFAGTSSRDLPLQKMVVIGGGGDSD